MINTMTSRLVPANSVARNCLLKISPSCWSGGRALESGTVRTSPLRGEMRSWIGNPAAGRRGMVASLALLLTVPCFCAGQTGMQSQASSSTARSTAAGASISGLTDEPIFPGEIVNVGVYNAPDFSTVARVSEGGEIALPYLGIVHVAGLSSAGASDLVEGKLKDSNLMSHPHVIVTVDSTSTGITVLGEVKTPGIYTPSGKHMLSDLLAMAGGLTANTGRIVEISSESAPEQKTLLPWDPTMHNTSVYDRVINPGERVLVRPCGVVYVGGNVGRPGAFPICASQITTVSQVVAMALGAQISSYQSHTILVRTRPDGTRILQQIDIGKVLKAKAPDPVVQPDDIIYVPLSGVKYTLRSLPGYVANLGSTALNVYR
jgi:polysaccharide biosynthesis/export protein